MNFQNFRQHFSKRKFFTREETRLFDKDMRISTLTDWQKLGYIENLARGVWGFVEKGEHLSEEHLYSLSAIINPHSYVSLESVFRLYGLIPEEVYTTTCVTTTKTMRYTTPLGRISYQKIPLRTYTGYEWRKIEGQNYQIASLEKAILDYLWLHKDVCEEVDFVELRWNPHVLAELDIEALKNMQKLYDKKPFRERVDSLISYISSLPPIYAQL